jgi:hypothetical protein
MKHPMLIKILIGLAVVIAIFLLVVAFQPSEFRVTRSASIPVPAPVVFEQVNDLHKWQAWSPWAKMDPASKIAFEGPPAGVGASFSWAGNDKVGEGRMTIIDSRPNVLVRFKLEFKKPFEGTNYADFAFQSNDGQPTTVTWTMTGENNFIFKAMSLFMNCDKMVGDQFEAGLKNLTEVSEAAAKQ